MNSAPEHRHVTREPLPDDVPVLETPDIIESKEVGEEFPAVLTPLAKYFTTRTLPAPFNTRDRYPLVHAPEAAHPTTIEDDSPSYSPGTQCLARLRMIPWCFRDINLPRVYPAGHLPSDKKSMWTDWMGGVIEKEMRSMTISGAIVKSYIVRAMRPSDRQWIRLRVIPYFGELLVLGDPPLVGNHPSHAHPVVFFQQVFDSNNAYVGILTDIVSTRTGQIQQSMYLWCRVVMMRYDREKKEKVLATVQGGPYDRPQHSYLSITVGSEVPLLAANSDTRHALFQRGAVIWNDPAPMQSIRNMGCELWRRAEDAITPV
ncbi:hypothetical protein DAEQUDRAFT_765657 [Daedalea quercina L-15889]|uniref:Uncharacterized protein n=1 Tax=Daedalea quercina L-15889 TaxID=1314783 RepID=A0A165Q773_9APHY|nr:hypothetical protein DAEQUDRAFT_765657 [Daedalea quercina L-15889]